MLFAFAMCESYEFIWGATGSGGVDCAEISDKALDKLTGVADNHSGVVDCGTKLIERHPVDCECSHNMVWVPMESCCASHLFRVVDTVMVG